jgi:hypothetical protein
LLIYVVNLCSLLCVCFARILGVLAHILLENTCTSAYEMQCFDAFGMTVPAVDTGGDDCNDSVTHTEWFAATLAAVLCVAGMAVGVAATRWYYTSSHQGKGAAASTGTEDFNRESRAALLEGDEFSNHSGHRIALARGDATA